MEKLHLEINNPSVWVGNIQNYTPKYTVLLSEKFNNTQGVITSRISKDRQYNGQEKKDKRTSNDLHNNIRKLKIEHHEPTQKPGMNSGGPEGEPDPAPQVILVVIYFCYKHGGK